MPGRPSLRWNTGLAPSPPLAGSGYPDSSNTGVPDGTSLTLYGGSELFTSSNGQVIDAMEVQGSIIVQHTNVTISRCLVNTWTIYGIDCEGSASCTITDSTIVGGDAAYTNLYNTNMTVQRCDISRGVNGMAAGHNVTVEDCFFHDLYNLGDDPHADCIEMDNGAGVHDVTFRHNTFLSRGYDGSDTTSCIISTPSAFSPTDVTITNNVFAGGAYSLYGPTPGTGVRWAITDNKFWDLYFPGTGRSGFFGTWSDATDEATVTGNEIGRFSGGYDSTNQLILGTWSGTPLA